MKTIRTWASHPFYMIAIIFLLIGEFIAGVEHD